MDCPVEKNHHCRFVKDIKFNNKNYELFLCEECKVYYIASLDFAEGKRFVLSINGNKHIVTNIYTNYLRSKLTIGTEVFSTKEEYQKHLKELKHIDTKSFIIKTNVFRCSSANHSLQNITASVYVLNRRTLRPQLESVNAGYCAKCNRYVILKSVYDNLVEKKGEILSCNIYDMTKNKSRNANGSSGGMYLREESILHRYGYSVAKENGMSAETRKKILATLIDFDILTHNEILSYLDFFIEFRCYNPIFEDAISKWEDDADFVREYKKGRYTEVGVAGFYI